MRVPAPPLPSDLARRMLEAVLGDARGEARAEIRFPEALEGTAEALAAGLAALGTEAELRLSEDAVFAARGADAADLWVPAPAAELPRLILCFGARPWSAGFEDDYLVELAAMANREALKAAGHRLVFVEWPRGARRDAEVDLRPAEMAAIFERSLDLDYGALRARNAGLLEALEGAQELALRCPEGTDLSLSVDGRRFIAEDCVLSPEEPVVFLPGGEVYAPAVEDSAAGVVAFRHCGAPRLARFEGGLLVAVEGAGGARDAQLEEEMGAGTEPLCEIGVGSNPWAPPWQIGTLYEKSAGTVHVAVGGNAHFGGERDSPRHADLIIRRPELQRVGSGPLALPVARWEQP